MKTLISTHKKWVLASCLLAALTSQTQFINASVTGEGDFASSSENTIETKVTTAEGVIKVVYIKSGENEVMAVVPKTEGQAPCNYCGTYSLPVSLKANKDNLDELNVALLKAFTKNEKEEKEVASAKPIPKQRDKDVEIDDETNPLLARIEKKCEAKKSNDDSLSCFNTELAKVLRSKNAKIDANELRSFFTANIAPLLRNELDHSRNTVSSVVGSRNYSSREDYLWAVESAQDEIANIEDRRRTVVDSLQELVEATGKKHAAFRRTLLTAQSKVVEESARQIRLLRQAEKQNEKSNPSLATEYGLKANNQTSDLLRWSDLINESNSYALRTLRDNNALSGNELSSYDRYVQDFGLALRKYLVSDAYGTNNSSLPSLLQNQNIQGNQIQPGSQLQQQNGSVVPRFQLPGVPGEGGQNGGLMMQSGSGLQINNAPYRVNQQQIQTRQQIHNRHK
ncbi:MAG: hypothetical protein ACLGGX_06800 [Bdellovibrionia bacterium]